MLRVSENPDPRWPAERSLYDDLGKWWVVRTRPRNEKALAWDLSRIGVGYYLPLMTKRTIRRDTGKPRKSIICLFPGYISVVDYQERRLEVLRTGRVINAMEVVDQAKFVAELESVRKAVEHAREVGLHSRLAVGRKVIITSGPLQGVQGVVLDMDRPKKIYLNVDMFNRAVTVTVSPEQLDPL
jgi:transcriptional antiterminator RfaH